MANAVDQYKIHTVDYPPFISNGITTHENGNNLIEVTKLAFDCVGLDYEIVAHNSWDEAYDNVVLYRNAVFAADVLNKFKLKTEKSVDTGFTVTYSVYSNIDMRNRYLSLDDLKGKRVGVIADRITGNYDFDRMYLSDKKADFSKFIDANHAISAVIMGWVDYAVLPEETVENSLKYDFGRAGDKVIKLGAINKAALRLIFNRNANDSVVSKIQNAFELVKLNNSQKFCP